MIRPLSTSPAVEPGFQATEKIVCYCLNVTEARLTQILDTQDCRTLGELVRCTGAGGGCTACHRRLASYLERGETRVEQPLTFEYSTDAVRI